MPVRSCSWPWPRRRYLPFVLLRHSGGGTGTHFDLLLETTNGTCTETRSLWALQTYSKPNRRAQRLVWSTHGLHRRQYLTYEGSISEGRGRLKRVDAGVYLVTATAQASFIVLNGLLIGGRYEMFRVSRGQHLWMRRDED